VSQAESNGVLMRGSLGLREESLLMGRPRKYLLELLDRGVPRWVLDSGRPVSHIAGNR
jgi:hypothetical protein